MRPIPPERLPVYVRIGDGEQRRIGTVSTRDPALVHRAVAELLRACALIITDDAGYVDDTQEQP